MFLLFLCIQLPVNFDCFGVPTVLLKKLLQLCGCAQYEDHPFLLEFYQLTSLIEVPGHRYGFAKPVSVVGNCSCHFLYWCAVSVHGAPGLRGLLMAMYPPSR